MSKTIKEQMRVLVKEHERGLLPKDDYRRLRAALLERAMEGRLDAPDEPTHTRPQHVNKPDVPAAVPPTVTAPRKASPKPPPPAPPPESAPKPPLPSPPPPSPPPVEPARSKSVLLGAVVAGVIVLLGAYLLLNRDSGDTPPEVKATSSTETHRTAAIDQLVDNFVQEGNWSPGSIRRFSRDWNDLDPEVRRHAKTTSTFREFARELRDRLKLSEQSNTLATTTSLRALAQSLELRVDSRFVVAESAAPEGKTPNSLREKTTSAAPLQNQQATESEPSTAPTPDATDAPDMRQQLNPLVRAKPQTSVNGSNEPKTRPVSADNPALDEPVKVVAPRRNEVEAPVERSINARQEPGKAASGTNTPKEIADEGGKVDNPPVTPAAVTPADTKPAQVSGSRGVDCTRSVLKTRRKYCRDQLLDGSDGPKLALIRSGSFQMGSPQKDEEQPVHQVSIDNPFAMGVNEVSFAEFNRYCQATGRACPDNPWGDENLPVVNVSWSEARQYTDWLSAQSGTVYRLPTEAEWEYAARAGTKTAFPFGEDISYLQAHFSDTRRQDRPLPVDGKLVASNDFGLKHIVGNVSEWVEDAWSDNYSRAAANAIAFTGPPDARRVIRGGSYHDRATDLRSASRSSLAAQERTPYTGFRVAREIR